MPRPAELPRLLPAHTPHPWLGAGGLPEKGPQSRLWQLLRGPRLAHREVPGKGRT